MSTQPVTRHSMPIPAQGAPLLDIIRGAVTCLSFTSDSSLKAYLYVPKNLPKGRPARLFIAVHGISRNAEEHARRFAAYAERHGLVLLAPFFSEDEYPRYQRLGGRRGNLKRADLALLTMLDELNAELNVDTSRFYLFGFSGGGQFAHRFAMAHPQRVISYVVAAAGWYTTPDPNMKFPRGIGPNRYFADLRFDLAAFLSIPATVIVGERDTKPGTSLNQAPRLMEEQGLHRLERGENWVFAMRETALAYGIDPHFDFVIAPRCGHSFRRAMRRGGVGDVVFNQFFPGKT